MRSSEVFYEIRQYWTKPGQRPEWVTYMETVVLPYMVERGISVTGSFLDEQDEDGYVWIRRFDNERDRENGYAAVYETPRWTDEIGPRVYELLDVDRTVVTRATPTTVSALR
jgi:hypothetical protein